MSDKLASRVMRKWLLHNNNNYMKRESEVNRSQDYRDISQFLKSYVSI